MFNKNLINIWKSISNYCLKNTLISFDTYNKLYIILQSKRCNHYVEYDQKSLLEIKTPNKEGGESSWPLAVVCVDCRCVHAHRRDSRDDSPTLAARCFTFSVSVALAEREAAEISPLAAKYAGARGTGAECLCSVIKPKRSRAVSFKETLEHERDIVITLESVSFDARQVKRVKSRPGSISWHCSSTRHDRFEYTDEHALAASYNIHANIAEVIDSLLHCAKRDDVSLESDDDDYYTTKSKFAAQRNNKLKDSKMSATSVQTNSESLSRTKIKSTRSNVYCIYYAHAGETDYLCPRDRATSELRDDHAECRGSKSTYRSTAASAAATLSNGHAQNATDNATSTGNATSPCRLYLSHAFYCMDKKSLFDYCKCSNIAERLLGSRVRHVQCNIPLLLSMQKCWMYNLYEK
ncbi:unnamed protein product [Trichogramma brassicae]|uniref:Uncharacterized protein n=1 Tax=Trichogramma brassicae TaxID=86971 RepID=A0A6H5IIJ1_9HYME|nr:unnamed protein product [Trichogramma brassicae]